MRWVALILVAPLAMAGVVVDQGATINSTSQEAFATLAQGDKGTATIGASGTQADISVSALSILTEDDILDIVSTDDSWQVKAVYRSHSGFAGLGATITLRLNDGVLPQTEITITNGVVTLTEGLPVDVPSVGATELRAIASVAAFGTLELDLVFTKDSGPGPVLSYPVTIAV